MFTIMYRHRRTIEKLGLELQMHNRQRNTGLTSMQFAKSKHARSSFVTLSSSMNWLLPKFEKFRPEMKYTGVWLLLLRLLQTSFMAFAGSQRTQAAMMCCLTVSSILLHSLLSPMRRDSDNQVALLCQALVFLWVFILLCRIIGMFEGKVAAAAIGTVLCVATFAVFATAFVLANLDRLREQRADRADSKIEISNDDGEEDTPERPQPHDDVGAVEIEMSSLPHGQRESPSQKVEDKSTTSVEAEDQGSLSSNLPWSLLVVGASTFCSKEAEATEDDEEGGTRATRS